MGTEIYKWENDWCFDYDYVVTMGADYKIIPLPIWVKKENIEEWLEDEKTIKEEEEVNPEIEPSMLMPQWNVYECAECGNLQAPDKKRHAVRCNVCGKFHPSESKDYVAVFGNITYGTNGGIVGNNLKDSVVKKVSTFCHGCFIEIVTKKDDDPITIEPKCPKGQTLGEYHICTSSIHCKETTPEIAKTCYKLSKKVKNNEKDS